MGVNIIELMELLPIVKHHQTQPPLTGDSLIIQVWIKGKRWKQYKKLKRLLIENVYCTKMDLQQLVERHVTHFPRYDDGFGKAKHGGRANRKRRWIQYILYYIIYIYIYIYIDHLQLFRDQIFFCIGMMMGLGKRAPNSISNGGELGWPTYFLHWH